MPKPTASRASAGLPTLIALVLSLLPRRGAGPVRLLPLLRKNKVKYDNFDWRIYKSPHFEVYYYREFEQHLERWSPTPRAPTRRSRPTEARDRVSRSR